MRVDICIPIHNEATILEQNLRILFDFCKQQQWSVEWRIVLIVNNSTDSSAAIARALAADKPEFRVVELSEGGKGNALYAHWDRAAADILCFMDADLATDINALPSLLEPLAADNADIVIGSRHIPGARVKRSLKRELASRVYNQLSRFIIGHSFSDLQCGFKALSYAAFSKVKPYVLDRRWFFDTELIMFAQKMNLRIKEIPVAWHDTRSEKYGSHIHLFSDSLNFFISLLKLRPRLRHIGKK